MKPTYTRALEPVRDAEGRALEEKLNPDRHYISRSCERPGGLRFTFRHT
jgi:hypothetical protein